MPHPAVFWIFSSLLIIMSIVIICGIAAILKVQIINFYIGKTTNERFSTHTETQHRSNYQPNAQNNEADDDIEFAHLKHLSHSNIRVEKSIHANENVEVRETKRVS